MWIEFYKNDKVLKAIKPILSIKCCVFISECKYQSRERNLKSCVYPNGEEYDYFVIKNF